MWAFGRRRSTVGTGRRPVDSVTLDMVQAPGAFQGAPCWYPAAPRHAGLTVRCIGPYFSAAHVLYRTVRCMAIEEVA